MVFGGRASGMLAGKIANQLDVDLGQADLRTFSNGEVYCRYQESIRGADVFIVQSTAANVAAGMTPNDALMELLCMIDAAQGASAHRIIAVMPWYGYARQDKKSLPREPISARVVAKTLEAVGTDRVLTMDLHAGQVQGFFEVPVDHMTAMPMLTQWFIDQHFDEELVIVSPDAGRVKVARNFARKVGTHWAVMEKERPAQQVAEIGYVVGDVKGKTAVLVDDMIDTAGTLCAAAKTVLDEGAARVIACATHGVFSGPAFERLAYENSQIERIVVTDTIPLAPGPRQHHGALDRADPGRLDPPDLHRRFGLRDLRRREPAVLGRCSRDLRRAASDRAGYAVAQVGGTVRGDGLGFRAGRHRDSERRPDDDAIAPGTFMALVAMGLGVFVIANDFTALNVALPAIEGDLNADVGSVQWVINAYALVFGMAIVSGGRLADMFGRRRIFFIGSILFAAFSALGAVSPDLGVLIGARVGMGVGGALMWPAILGMTFAALPESKAGLAGGLILGVAGIGNAVGPLLGGALTEAPQLALDLRRQRPDRRLRDVRHLAQRPSGAGALRRADRLRRDGDHLRRPRLPPAGPRSGRRLGLGRPAGRRDVRPLGRPDRLLRLHRAARRLRAR